MSQIKSLPKLFPGNNDYTLHRYENLSNQTSNKYSSGWGVEQQYKLDLLNKVKQHRQRRQQIKRGIIDIQMLRNNKIGNQLYQYNGYDHRYLRKNQFNSLNTSNNRIFKQRQQPRIMASNKYVQTQIQQIVRSMKQKPHERVRFNSFLKDSTSIPHSSVNKSFEQIHRNKQYDNHRYNNNPEQLTELKKPISKKRIKTMNIMNQHSNYEVTQFEVRQDRKNLKIQTSKKHLQNIRIPNTQNIKHNKYKQWNEHGEQSSLNSKYENYKPKSDLISKIDSSKFQIKKYKNGVYFGNLKDGKKDGKGILFYDDGRIYQGHFKDDLKNGQGIQTFLDGSFYEGSFIKNYKEGRGKFEWSNGETYEGNWLKGHKNGTGVWKSQNGESYIGEWENGVIEGYGVYVMSNGDRYQGYFKESQKCGKGTLRYRNGSTYIGQFKRNKPEGLGQIYDKKSYYRGYFVNGVKHGKGREALNDGSIYEGQYRNDKRCGYGELVDQQGIIYMGQFKNGLRHGYGQLYDGSQLIYEGNWINDHKQQIYTQNSADQEEQVIRQESNQEDIPKTIKNSRLNKNRVIRINKYVKQQEKQKVLNVKNDIKFKNDIKDQIKPSLSPNQSRRNCGCLRKH